MMTTSTLTDARINVTYEHPGILVIADTFGGGDVGIDDWREEGDGFRVFVYEGSWGDSDVIRGIATIPTYEAIEPRALADAIARATPNGWEIELPALSSLPRVLITPTHVFAYQYDDGGSCCGIVHRVDHPADCVLLGCDASLLESHPSARRGR